MNAPAQQAKASALSDRSNAIIVSFDAKWHSDFGRGVVSSVIRKRIPKDANYEWLYVHINSPIGAICGRTKIKRIHRISLEEAIGLSKEIGLSGKDISTYIADDPLVGCYQVSSFEVARKPAATKEINRQLAYSPPQSFVILSKNAKQIIDTMCGFQETSIEGAKHRDV